MLTSYNFNLFKFDSIVMHKTTSVGCVVLKICVDCILLTHGDELGIFDTKYYLQMHLVT